MIAIPIVAIVMIFVYMVVTTSLHYAERIKIHEENIKRLENGYPPIEQTPLNLFGANREPRAERKNDRIDMREYDDEDDRYGRN